MKNKTQTQPTQGPTALGIVIKFFVPLLILLGAGGFFIFQMKTKPMAKRQKPPRQAKQVHVVDAKRQDVRAVVDKIQGPVMPSQAVSLSPQVSGLVDSLNPNLVPGGIVTQGQVLLGIDTSDYVLALEQRQSDLAKAKLALALEQGNQVIAKQEYDMLDEEVSEEDKVLVLRQPHLEDAKAALKSAEAAVAKAKLDLKRCQVAAPFNAVIREKNVDLGARVAPGTSLVALAGTDECWIEVGVAVNRLPWIDIPMGQDTTGSKVKVYDTWAWGEGQFREGTVIRLLSDIESGGLMARLLISIQDPMALKPENQGKPVLLMGTKVDVEIQGNIVENVIPIQREWLRDGKYIWVMSQDDTLEIHEVTTNFRGEEQVCVVDGLEDGQRIIVTDIAAPVEGMPLRLPGQEASEPNAPMAPQGKGE